MQNKKFNLIVVICAVLMITFAFSGESFAKKRIIFGGGPAGGTFQVVANGIQVYKPVKDVEDFTVKAQTSAGSVENLRKPNAGRQQMGVVYSGHVWLGRNGKMKNDTKKYENVLAVAWLYGAPAQMVVRAGSGIKSVKDLAGKKVGVGNAGSGAFANCELFFTHMGIWDKIERNAMGYNDAAAAFGNKQLDAFWLFTAFPSGAVIMAAQTNDIALLDLDADAKASGFYDKYPYFGKLAVPAGTYKGEIRVRSEKEEHRVKISCRILPFELRDSKVVGGVFMADTDLPESYYRDMKEHGLDAIQFFWSGTGVDVGNVDGRIVLDFSRTEKFMRRVTDAGLKGPVTFSLGNDHSLHYERRIAEAFGLEVVTEDTVGRKAVIGPKVTPQLDSLFVEGLRQINDWWDRMDWPQEPSQCVREHRARWPGGA